MPTPFASPVILSPNARTELQALVQASSTPQSLSLRARIVLRATDTDTPTNLQIGRALGCCNHTVGKWRRRDLAQGLSGLQDAIRPGRPRTIASSTRVQVISVASTPPQDQERAITHWTLDEIVATLLDARHTDTISRSSIWRILNDLDLKPHQSEVVLENNNEPLTPLSAQGLPLFRSSLQQDVHVSFQDVDPAEPGSADVQSVRRTAG